MRLGWYIYTNSFGDNKLRIDIRGGYFTAQQNEEGWWLDSNWLGYTGIQFDSFEDLEQKIISFMEDSLRGLRKRLNDGESLPAIAVEDMINLERELESAHDWPYSLFI